MKLTRFNADSRWLWSIAAALLAQVAFIMGFDVRVSHDDGFAASVFHLAGFAVAVLLALSLHWTAHRSPGGASIAWRVIATIGMLGTIGLFFWYASLLEQFTCWYADRVHFVTGTAWTASAEQFIKRNPEAAGWTCKELIAEFGGTPELIWEKNELLARRSRLAGLYLAFATCCALTIFAGVQLVSCIARRDER